MGGYRGKNGRIVGSLVFSALPVRILTSPLNIGRVPCFRPVEMKHPAVGIASSRHPSKDSPCSRPPHHAWLGTFANLRQKVARHLSYDRLQLCPTEQSRAKIRRRCRSNAVGMLKRGSAVNFIPITRCLVSPGKAAVRRQGERKTRLFRVCAATEIADGSCRNECSCGAPRPHCTR